VGGDLQGAAHLVEVVLGQLGGQVLVASFKSSVDLVDVGLPQILPLLRSAVGCGHAPLRLLATGPASGDVRHVEPWVHDDAIAVG
jgi:hypothetical protein